MIKKEAGADELAALMKLNMKPRFPTPEEKIASALDHLNIAAEAFDEAGNSKFADLVTNFMVKFAQG